MICVCEKIRVVDKVPPTTGWLNDRHKVSVLKINVNISHTSLQAAFSKVEFKQANLANNGWSSIINHLRLCDLP